MHKYINKDLSSNSIIEFNPGITDKKIIITTQTNLQHQLKYDL